jgi:hypothetical protein
MKPWLALPLVLVLAAYSWTRVYYAPAGEMVRRSEFIAVVDVRRVRAVDERGGRWRYAQAADAVVLRTYKGRLPARIAIHAQEDFICSRVEFRPGRYLVFLRRDGELLAGSNWYLSARPIRDGAVEWYANSAAYGSDESRIPLRQIPLDRVIAEIRRHQASARTASRDRT